MPSTLAELQVHEEGLGSEMESVPEVFNKHEFNGLVGEETAFALDIVWVKLWEL